MSHKDDDLPNAKSVRCPFCDLAADNLGEQYGLTTMHHWAFDLGLWSLTDDLRVLVARSDSGSGDDLSSLDRYESAPLKLPSPPLARPHELALEWHRDVCFQGS